MKNPFYAEKYARTVLTGRARTLFLKGLSKGT